MKNVSAVVSALALIFAFSGCGGGSDSGGGGISLRNGNLMPVKAARANGPYADTLEHCVNRPTANYCRFSRLPLLGMETSLPTTEEIMQRTLVSHDWMTARFEAFLNDYPVAMRKLFRGVTAIVIAGDIRPAFYTTSTGAIYLDAHYFWLTQEEKADMDSSADFRSGFGSELQYVVGARYIKDNDHAYRYYPLNSQEQRSFDDVKFFLARLLIHELAHANDFFPPSAHAGINRQLVVPDAARNRRADWVSEQMQENHSLESAKMKSLAGVNFFGHSSTAAERAMTPDDVRDEVRPDLANDDYNYSTEREDLAMISEEAMMAYMFDIQRDVGVLHLRDENEKHQIAWAVRNRIGKENIKNKGRYIFDRLLPNENLTAFWNTLPAEQELPRGEYWQDEVDQGGEATGDDGSVPSFTKQASAPPASDDFLRLYD